MIPLTATTSAEVELQVILVYRHDHGSLHPLDRYSDTEGPVTELDAVLIQGKNPFDIMPYLSREQIQELENQCHQEAAEQ